MTIQNARQKFTDIVNKNSTNDSVSVSKSRFIRIFNTAQNSYVNWVLEKLNQKERRSIQVLFTLNKKVSKSDSTTRTTSFTLPSDYFGFQNLHAYASEGECKKQPMLMEEIKGENVNILLSDLNSKPSFKFREGFFQLGGDNFILYKDEQGSFEYSDIYVDYFRQPRQVDIEGYVKSDNTSSVDIHPEFDDELVDTILLIGAKAFNSNNDNLDRYQVDTNNIITKF